MLGIRLRKHAKHIDGEVNMFSTLQVNPSIHLQIHPQSVHYHLPISYNRLCYYVLPRVKWGTSFGSTLRNSRVKMMLVQVYTFLVPLTQTNHSYC